MNTTRNRSKVLALALRASIEELRGCLDRLPIPLARCGPVVNALASIDTVADELDAVAAGRDLPAECHEPQEGPV